MEPSKGKDLWVLDAPRPSAQQSSDAKGNHTGHRCQREQLPAGHTTWKRERHQECVNARDTATAVSCAVGKNRA